MGRLIPIVGKLTASAQVDYNAIDVARQPSGDIVIVMKGNAELLEIIAALGSPGRFPRRLHRGQQQRHEDADDGNYDQQFDKCKSTALKAQIHDIRSAATNSIHLLVAGL
jgi:hypothetical protein